jgi:hypothetical protein
MLFLLFVLHNFKNDEKGNAFSAFSAFWELGRFTPPMGERWDEGVGEEDAPAPKKQKKQKKHCLFPHS